MPGLLEQRLVQVAEARRLSLPQRGNDRPQRGQQRPLPGVGPVLQRDQQLQLNLLSEPLEDRNVIHVDRIGNPQPVGEAGAGARALAGAPADPVRSAQPLLDGGDPQAGGDPARPERGERLDPRLGQEPLRRQTGLPPLAVVPLAEPHPQVGRPLAAADAAQLLTPADLAARGRGEFLHRQAAHLEPPGADSAQVRARRADPGLAVSDGALAQPEQRMRPRRGEHLVIGVPSGVCREFRAQQRPQPGNLAAAVSCGLRADQRQRGTGGASHTGTWPAAARGSSTRSMASRSRSGEGCK